MASPPLDAADKGARHRLVAWIDREISRLFPGCFAMVMATGIISNAMVFTGHRAVSDALLAVNCVLLPWLLTATTVRALRHRAALWADLTSPQKVFGFFTIVAACDVFGASLGMRGLTEVAIGLWFAALILWTVLIYFSFGVLTFLKSGQGVNVVHGGWLIAIVGTQSLVVLGADVAPELGAIAPSALVLIHMLWGIGLGLYGIFITLFAHRIFFFAFEPKDITPLLWVVMGAAAISTNAGSMLILTDTGMPFLEAMRPFVDGMSLIMWAWGSWWIPLLILFGLWKHGICRVPVTYTPMLWSLVFPVGMYALASLRLSLAADFTPLGAVARTMVWVALALWLATAAGFLRASWRSFSRFRAQPQPAPS